MPGVVCPTAPYTNQDAFLANWVGIDGFSDGTVEQLGTAAQCYEGVTYYYVWYEMFPAGTVEEGTTACINDNVNCPAAGRPDQRVGDRDAGHLGKQQLRAQTDRPHPAAGELLHLGELRQRYLRGLKR